MKSRTPKTTKTPLTIAEASPTKPPKAAKAKAAPPNPLEGVSIRAEVLSYTPTLHRPRVHIKTPSIVYYKLVLGVRCTTKAEALQAAQQYREQILASGALPPRADRFGARA